MRLIQKSKLTFVCKVCNMRGQQLFRLYGQWPPREFEELTKDAQEAFWLSLGDMKKGCEELVCNTLSKNLVEREEKLSSGEFQPLVYWEKLGYDIERIMANTPAHMRKMSPQLGETFKVVIHKETAGQVEEKVRTQLLSRRALSSDSNDKVRPSFLDDPEKSKKDARRKRDKKRKRSSSSESSSCSAGGAGQHGAGKSALAAKKAERKAATKQREKERDEKKSVRTKVVEQRKTARMVHTMSNKVLSRCSPIQVSPERDLEDPAMKRVPNVVKNQSKTALAACNSHLKMAKDKLAQEDPAPWGDAFVTAFDVEVKSWAEAALLLSSQLAAIKRATM